MPFHLIPRYTGVLAILCLSLLLQILSQVSWFADLGIGTLTLAIIVGMVIGSIYAIDQHPKWLDSITFCKNDLLKLGVILYGFRLNLQQVQGLGSAALISDFVVLGSTFLLCYLIGVYLLKLKPINVVLIGAGSSICGAAAVVATGASIRANAQQQASAISTVVVFGTLSLLLYPFMHQMDIWGLSEQAFAIYIGSSVHEVAQVVAAGSAINAEVAQMAITTKMLRVMMLAPFLLLLIRYLPREEAEEGKNKLTVPWFAFIFIFVVVVNSVVSIPETGLRYIFKLDDYLLIMAMLALGLNSSLATIRLAGIKPFILAGTAFVWLVVAGALLQKLLS